MHCCFGSKVYNKLYEYKDHLGNVRVVTKDVKLRTATNLPFKTSVLSYSNYYPFGMQYSGTDASTSSDATYESDEYRYGYSGQEKDDEIEGEGNHINFQYRCYDPRIGRFYSIDPLESSYPSQSPYHYAGNTPIQAIDLEGLELFLVNGYDGVSGATKEASKSEQLNEMRKYWTNNNPNFIKQVSEGFKEKDVRFLDGSQGGVTHGDVWERWRNGRSSAIKLMNEGKIDFSKPITIVAHSQGGAYASGFAGAILKEHPDAVVNVLLLAPDGAEQFNIDPRTNTVQYTFPDDMVVTDEKTTVRGADLNLSPSQKYSPFVLVPSLETGVKAHSVPIDDEFVINRILNNDKAKKIFKTKSEKNDTNNK